MSMMKNNKFTQLWIAAGSLVFVSACLPILDSIVNLFTSVINAKIGRMQIGLELHQKEAEAAADVIRPSGPNDGNCIGFQIPSESDYEDDDYE